MKRTRGAFLAFFAAAGIAACGGGGGGDSATPGEGLYNGSTSDGRTVHAMLLDDGSYWVLYSAVGESAVLAGAIQGTGGVDGGVFSSSDGKDFNGDVGLRNATIQADYSAGSSVSGTVSFSGGGGSASFTTTYDTSYEQTPSVDALAGSHLGSGYTLAGPSRSSMTITGGTVSGVVQPCDFTGTIAPRTHGNVFDLKVTFTGATCGFNGMSFSGAAYYDATVGQIIAAAVNGARDQGFVFVEATGL